MKKVLFVEDDAIVAKIYSQALTEGGFETALAEDGLIAMKRLKEFKPDLVVLDLMMPKMSGLDVIKFLREQPATKSTPVIVFSNAFLNDVGEKVSSFGVEEMMAKPAASPTLLVERVSQILYRTEMLTPSPLPQAGPATPDVPLTGPPSNVPPPNAWPITKEADPAQRSENANTFRKRIRRDFFEQIPAISKGIELACREFLETTDPSTRALRLEGFNRKIGFITHMTSMAACYRIAQLSSALEALLFELREKPAALNESLRRTIETTVALLISWLARADQPDDQCLSPTTVLVVDDDAVSNRAVVLALSRVNLAAKSVTDPFKALEKLRQSAYDAVLMDINLPGMTGIALREQMREMPMHHRTPVIFITSHTEFEPQARAVASVGDDFITKPILPIELTVKVTAHVLKRRLAEQSASVDRSAGQSSFSGLPR
jgi:CheY-like chemotaxis protein